MVTSTVAGNGNLEIYNMMGQKWNRLPGIYCCRYPNIWT
jgi:hypothetical protein